MAAEGVGSSVGDEPVPAESKKTMPGAEDGDENTCRICRGEGSLQQPLFFPCKCSGSIKYVHQECLMEWLAHTQKKYCELCKTSFKFTKLYDEAMPDRLPLLLFLQQLALHACQTVGRWLRYVVVAFIWTCWLPLVVRQIWRGLFWLADGSWMTPQDVRRLITTESGSLLSNATLAISQSSSSSIEDMTKKITTSAAFAKPLGETFTALKSALFLRILLRLISPKINERSLIPADEGGQTDMFPADSRHSSLLSDVQALSSLTNYPVVNSCVIDVLEGQLICLSVIAAFILVFLIREWVINQQPIQNMPDPDRVDQAAPPIPQENEVRAGAQRRWRGARNIAPDLGHEERLPLEIGQRPRLVPRPRRVATEDTANPSRGSDQVDRSPLLSESASIGTGPISPDAEDVQNTDTQSGPEQIESPVLLNLESPPLRRGALDWAVDINRNLEENNRLANAGRTLGVDAPHRSDFTFTASFAGGNSLSDSLVEDTPRSHTSTVVSPATEDDWITASDESDSDNGQQGDYEMNASEDETSSRTDETPTVSQVDSHETIWERLAKWLWDVDEIVRQEGIAASQEGDAQPLEPRPEIDEDREGQAAMPEPGAVEPAHEANIQFGIDLNDPNAMDEAEELEGILELIGMEGPIAGMLQNFFFSVFLITLTLSASVWCPYIWGKIALVTMSDPVGLFFTAPLYLISKVADVLVDFMLLCLGGLGILAVTLTNTFNICITPVFPQVAKFLDFKLMETFAGDLTRSSGVRLEKALSGTVGDLRPDLPAFSMQSHYVLLVFKRAGSNILASLIGDVRSTIIGAVDLWEAKGFLAVPLVPLKEIATFPAAFAKALFDAREWLAKLSNELKASAFAHAESVDYTLMNWSAGDRTFAIIFGYVFFTLLGLAYLRIGPLVLGLKKGEKMEGILAESLRQAGGVMKVIVIIGIEMIVFPLYCGLLLDVAMLPLFKNATFSGRVLFMMNAPVTGFFVHWFIGTCYMFHFALFVSMCRKILRRGVLYFIRDPDDPTFHPVRDVLERPVGTQLGKIFFSACIYGGLVILCLGSVVWSIGQLTTILPIRWASTEPRLAFPIDIVLFNFILPFILRKAEPSKKLSVVYEWWFRRCAKLLRLSHFLFGQDRTIEEMKQPVENEISNVVGDNRDKLQLNNNFSSEQTEDGCWVRAPAADSVRIPKGTQIFLKVDKHNRRLDGRPDTEKGLHGSNDERFIKVYIPSNFKMRVAAFAFLVWLFAASGGALLTLGPLLVGRIALTFIMESRVHCNDLYAFTLGMHICVALAYGIVVGSKRTEILRSQNLGSLSQFRRALSIAAEIVKYVVGLIYLAAGFGILVPMTLSLLMELYIHMPLFNYFTTYLMVPVVPISTGTLATTPVALPTIYIIQSWTLGVLYLRLLIRVLQNHTSPLMAPGPALHMIIRKGVLNPDVRLASRAFLLPFLVVSLILLTAPLGFAQLAALTTKIDESTRVQLFRNSYPTVLALAAGIYLSIRTRGKLGQWHVRIRDDVYLVGERLHNFNESDKEVKKEPLEQPVGVEELSKPVNSDAPIHPASGSPTAQDVAAVSVAITSAEQRYFEPPA